MHLAIKPVEGKDEWSVHQIDHRSTVTELRFGKVAFDNVTKCYGFHVADEWHCQHPDPEQVFKRMARFLRMETSVHDREGTKLSYYSRNGHPLPIV